MTRISGGMTRRSGQSVVAADQDRREFLSVAGGAAAATLAGVTVPGKARSEAAGASQTAFSNADEAIRQRAHDVRVAAARADREAPILPHPVNGDESRYPSRIGSDTRGLPHNRRGEVEPAAFEAALKAYRSGDPADFEAIPLGGTRKQLNPIGSLSVSPTGLNTTQFAVPPAPTLDSAQRAGEAVEVYWQSLLRDVPLTEFHNETSNKDILAAAEEINRLSAFFGPRVDARVTPETLFRGTALYIDRADPSGRTGRYVTPPGTLVGPYISQFLLKDAPYGSQYIPARIRTASKDSEFLTDYDEWLAVQDGKPPAQSTRFDAKPRFVATGRDLAEYSHNNPSVFWAAALLLATPPDGADPSYGGFGVPFAPSNPYVKSHTQTGASSTFGLPYIQGLLPRVASLAIRVAYWQKFYVQRVLRPEAYAGLVHHRVANKVDEYPVHGELLNSQALARSFGRNGTYLLSHVFPEGAPIHSSYPGGAAQAAAATITVLKAFFQENAVIANPVQPDPNDPTRVVPYGGPPLTVGGELNKLAWNYGVGRDWAGIHWRSDFSSSLPLGEEVAISILRDERLTYREPFDGFTFTRFDGSKITV